jgi:LytS/YehU family sensor histidine kinase
MCVLLSGLYFINYAYKTGLKLGAFIYLSVASVICFALYIGLEFINMQYIAYIIYLATFTGILSRIYSNTFCANSDDSTFYLSMSILHVTVSMQTCTELYTNNFINFLPLGYASSHVFLIIALFIFVYICFIVRTSREAYMASEYKLQLEKLRITMLREQINPHFIFNSLTAVKSLYHQNVEWGDHAMNLFSNHLRTNVEAIDKNLIPFEKELDNINDFVELENLKSSEPFNIIYDISCSNFYVPILSLQVYVENSIKYSKINNKDGGYIEISSYETDNEFIVEINDNGVGFDYNKVSESSFGIKNSRERFALLMGSKVEITSSLGEGTKVKIHIDKKFMIDEGNNENNNC